MVVPALEAVSTAIAVISAVAIAKASKANIFCLGVLIRYLVLIRCFEYVVIFIRFGHFVFGIQHRSEDIIGFADEGCFKMKEQAGCRGIELSFGKNFG